jgi:hypothetical protein
MGNRAPAVRSAARKLALSGSLALYRQSPMRFREIRQCASAKHSLGKKGFQERLQEFHRRSTPIAGGQQTELSAPRGGTAVRH